MGRFTATLLLILAAALPARAARFRADVVVYGATASGVIAAVSAAREGRTVLLVDPARHVGGMVSGGLGATDTGNRAAIGGTSREFFVRVRDHYQKTYGPDSPQAKACSDGYLFEPSVASLTFAAMLKEAKLTPHLDCPVEKVTKEGATLTTFRTATGDEFAGAVFIDASYEGDLMALAGVGSHVGREGKDHYGESLAGVQARSAAHQFSVKVPGLAAGGKLLPLIQPGKIEPPGTGDRKVQAYNFRLCLTDRAENRLPWARPKDYDPARYELLARYLKEKPGLKVGQLMNPVRVPNGKTDTNNNGPVSTDHIGANWDYPEADRAARARIWQDHAAYTQGFLWFLASDPRVPKELQAEMNRWGLAKDEFAATGNWPPQLYVREARRMVGAYVMTQADIFTDRTKADSVGLGSYTTDSHHVQRVVTPDGSALNEGDFQVPLTPYAIPYRSLTPKAAECDNLLVTVCCSASHIAYGTVRMEPVYMILGHAAGVAAGMAAEARVPVQKVDAEKLAARLIAQKAVLSPVGLPGRAAPGKALDPRKMAGVVVDNADAKLTGDWKRSSASSPLVGDDYLHDGNEDKGKLRARFVPNLPREGSYEVRLYHPPASNRATNALVVVHSADGEKRFQVDQKKAWKGDGVKLGVFRFARCTEGWVEVRNDDSNGHVIADAVQLVPVK